MERARWIADRIVPHFQEELEQLKTRLLEMGGLAEDRVRSAVSGLVERDAPLIDRVLAGDGRSTSCTSRSTTAASSCWRCTSRWPSTCARSSSAVKINTDLERVGDLAVNIAEAVAALHAAPAGQGADRHPAHGRHRAERCCATRSTPSCAATSTLAQDVLDEDDALDALKTQVFRELLTYMLQDPPTIEPALDLILISRHLERIGDHATNVAEDVIFMVSAKDVRHHAGEVGA